MSLTSAGFRCEESRGIADHRRRFEALVAELVAITVDCGGFMAMCGAGRAMIADVKTRVAPAAR
jgi:hypothetical protein